MTPVHQSDLPDGAHIYSHRTLWGYDFVVHTVTDRLVWRCPPYYLVQHIREHCSEDHLELGIGSGKLFANAIRQKTFSRLVVGDVNPACLEVASKNLIEWKPVIRQVDLLDLENPGQEILDGKTARFQSIGLNYVLHCLPCALNQKILICQKLLVDLAVDEGYVFGSTIMPQLNSSWLANRLMKSYNRKKIFGNAEDQLSSFESGLSDLGLDFQTDVRGSVCFFKINRK